MSTLNEAQRRVLTFVQAANHGGYSPTPEEVSEWVERPNLRPGKVTQRTVKTPGIPMPSTFGASILPAGYMDEINRSLARKMGNMPTWLGQSMVPPVSILEGLWESERVIQEREPDETLIEQVQRFRWVRTSSTGVGLVVTALGKALLRADADLTNTSEVIVLDGQDPLAWGALVSTIAGIGECVIVDPYLKAEQFLDIAKFTGTTRVLLRRPNSESELVRWRMYQAIPDVSVDIRVADPEHLHDRYIVGENAVYGLGCSLNGVGRKPTTLVPLTGQVADKIRATVEGWWEAAEPVGEPAPTKQEPEAADTAQGRDVAREKKRPKRGKGRNTNPKAQDSGGEAGSQA